MRSISTTIRGLYLQRPAWILASGAVLLSFAPILVRTSGSPPTTAAFYRMLFGGVILMAYLVFRRQRAAIHGRLLPLLFVAGVAFAFDLFFWHRSIHIVGPGLATLLAGFQVFVLAAVGIFWLGERLRWQLVFAIPTALFGVSLIIGVDWSALTPGYRVGIAFGLATACAYSAYLLLMRYVAKIPDKKSSAIADVAWMSLMCAGILLVLAFFSGESLAISDRQELIILLGYAGLAQLGLVMISATLKTVSASLVGLLLLLEPTFAYVWDILFFGRNASLVEVLGASLVIFAIYIASIGQGN